MRQVFYWKGTARQLFYLKRNKAPGPDGPPVEFFKDMNYQSAAAVRDLINKLRNGEPIPTELTQAQVILIFKRVANMISEITDLSLSLYYLQTLYSNYPSTNRRSARHTFTKHSIRIQKAKRNSTSSALH